MIDYSKIDPSIRELVRALNAFPGVTTIGSCGGHPDPGPSQWPEGSWYVKMKFDQTEEGWMALEFLAWAINRDYSSVHKVILLPTSAPPYLNRPGHMLAFALEGQETEADDLARFLNMVREDSFISAEEAEQLGFEEIRP
jgi:hypothetical protein